MPAALEGRTLPLALTMGDPAGIGLEITLKAWHARSERDLPPFVLLADPAAIAERARLLGGDVPMESISHPEQAVSIFAAKLPIIPISLVAKVQPGRADPANAAAVISSIEAAVDLVNRSHCAAVVTNPIAKATLTAAGFKHPGHTEFLGSLAERSTPGRKFHPVMMLASDQLRAVPLTVHIPLRDVPLSITRALIIDTVRTTWEALCRDFGVAQPRIAVAGLNPHAGESGTIGREEVDTIIPAIAELRAEGFAVTGPFPADTLFHPAARREYDAVVAMYHDQALIPLKTLAFDSGVNVTLGLPFVRTSPDHGTAFDIAALGKANPESLIQALLMAQSMTTARSRAPKVRS